MPFDFQQRKSFRFYVVFVLEDAAVGDAVLPAFPNCVTRMAVNLDISGF